MCEFERGTGAREIYPTLDQINKVRSKKSKGFSGRNRKFKWFFRPKTSDLQKKKVFTEIARDFPAEIGNSSGFSGRKQVIFKSKKRSSSQKRHKIWCQSTKNTNLDLDLRSRSTEPVNFFGAESSLARAQFSSGGGGCTSSQLGEHGPGMPPRGAGSVPECRLTASTPLFCFTGIDYYGLFYVKLGRSNAKRWGCLLACLSTRAVHIEVVNTLSSDSFINAPKRFIGRREKPTEIFGDNSSNFVGEQCSERH